MTFATCIVGQQCLSVCFGKLYVEKTWTISVTYSENMFMCSLQLGHVRLEY